MYLDFYGLAERPFNTTPDPRFLFLTPSHREALAQLIYGVQEGTGFVVLTGEVGTGKTTLLQALLQRLDPQVAVAMIVSPMLDFDGLLELILEDLGIAKGGADHGPAAGRAPPVPAGARGGRTADPGHHRRGSAPSAGDARADPAACPTTRARRGSSCRSSSPVSRS